MKKNKGFTIVELIVTISVMLLLMVVVVVAVNAISAKNKEKALLEVKKQTITAAKEFFSSNEYYSEDMVNGSELIVGVGRLVDEDYMNVVTNPVTGKKMNKCDQIKITKTSDGEYNYEFQDSNDSSCELDNIVVMTEPGAPAIINLKSTGTKTEKDYYTTDVKVSFFVDRKNNGEISEVKTCTANGSCDPLEQGTVINLKSANDIGNDYEVNNYKMSYNSILKSGDAKIDGNTVTISIIATNTSNKKATAQIVYKKDTVAPSCSTYESSDKVDLTNTSINIWTNKDRTITQKCTDGLSGCNSVSKTFTTSTEKSTIQVKDGAGNTKNCNLNVYVDKDDPVCGTTTGEGSTSTWTNQNRTITQECKDSLSGCNSTSYTQNFTTSEEKADISIYDKAGNKKDCTVKVYVDKGVPSATVSMYKNANSCGAATTTAYTPGSWYNKNVHTKVNVTNTTISGIKSITYTLDNAQAVSASEKTICTEGKHTIKYTLCNNAGTCATTTENQNVNIDKTNPVVKVEAYKGAVQTVNGLDTLDKVNAAINNNTVNAYSQNTWTNNSVIIKPSFSDNLSDLKTYSCIDSRQSSDASLDSFKTFRRVQGNWTGNFSFVCTVTDNAGNTASLTYNNVKRDIILPTCSSNNSPTTWTKNKSRTITQQCTDANSGCKLSQVSRTFTTEGKNGIIQIEDNAGNIKDCSVAYLMDWTVPSCGSADGQGSTSSWINKASSVASRTITQKCTDTISGCAAVTKTFSGDQTTNKITVTDGAGNTKDCTVGVYIDRTAPSCGSADGQGSTSSWINKASSATSRTITQKCSDATSNCSAVTKTFSGDQKTNTIAIYDGAGNSNSCSVGVYIDKTAPTISLTLTDDNGKTMTTSNWTNQKVTANVKVTEPNSGSGLNTVNRYWNKGGLDSSTVNTSSYTWNGSGYTDGGALAEVSGGVVTSDNNVPNAVVSNVNGNIQYTGLPYYSGQGIRKSRIVACDYANNCTSYEMQINIDKTAPSAPTVALVDGTWTEVSNNTWYNKNIYVSGQANKNNPNPTTTDKYSGVSYYQISTDNSTWTNWTYDYTSTTYKINVDGVTKRYVRAVDNAGNVSKVTTKTIKRDTLAPKIVKFENTQDTNCKTSSGNTCYYSHYVYADDRVVNSAGTTVVVANATAEEQKNASGLNTSLKYNHCYDAATSDQGNLVCQAGFTSTGTYKEEYLYTGGYANKSFSSKKLLQQYTYTNLASGKYYNLFYKIYDNAGNVTCYRYKLNYTTSNRTSASKIPSHVSGKYNCE